MTRFLKPGSDHNLLANRKQGDPHHQYIGKLGRETVRRSLCFEQPVIFERGIDAHTNNAAADDPEGDMEWLGNDSTAHRMLCDASDGVHLWGDVVLDASNSAALSSWGGLALQTERLVAGQSPYYVEQGVDLQLVIMSIPFVVTGQFLIVLPASPATGQIVMVKDGTGGAASNNVIDIDTQSGHKIENDLFGGGFAGRYRIENPLENVKAIFDGVNDWWLI